MRPRFSLRTLFVVMTLIALATGWRAHVHASANRLADQLNAGQYRRNGESKSSTNNSQIDDAAVYDADRVVAKIDSGSTWRMWLLPAIQIRKQAAEEGEDFRRWYRFNQTFFGFSTAEELKFAETKPVAKTTPVGTPISAPTSAN
jgi:hypothetical protein